MSRRRWRVTDGLLPGDLDSRGSKRMLGIRSGKAYFSHGPEVEYHVEREYSPDESGYVENLQS
jgi:hypothetical protein